ncbi:MAG: glycine cleavage system protein GcvH [bacterium]|nr:glycine cleavage system protein GcvH [bacterium]
MGLENLIFSKDHEWVSVEGGIGTIGISEYAQKELGDVVYVELPELDKTVNQGEACANIESVKAVSDIYAPVAGKIVEVNEALEDAPENINQDPYESGWIFRLEIEDAAELNKMMDYNQYEEYLKGLED